jgi:hypothetical protein
MAEPDALVPDVELAADLPEHVQERHHLLLPGAEDGDVALGRQRGAGPGGGLDPVRHRPVGESAQPVDTFDPDHPVGVDADDRAHLLQHRDQVHDLGLDRRVAQLGHALGPDRGQQHLLGAAHARVGQLQLHALQPVRRANRDAVRFLLDDRAELAQHVEVVIDRPVADPAAAEIRDERLTQAVQQRPAEQDRDPAGTGVRVDVGDVGMVDIARVQAQFTLGPGHVVHHHAVQLQQASDDDHVPDPGNVVQNTGFVPEQGRDHRLGDEVLGAANLQAADERGAAMDREYVVHSAHRVVRLR